VLSGITTFESGAPTTIGYSINNVGSLNLVTTGSSTLGPRVVILGSPTQDGGSTYQFINPSVFHPAQVGSLGLDSGSDNVREPGWQNWAVSVFKDFPFWKEGTKIQLRLEGRLWRWIACGVPNPGIASRRPLDSLPTASVALPKGSD
jgi:hypothetical protein